MLKRDPATRDTEVNAVLIDHYLWDYRREHAAETADIPFHKVRCIYYWGMSVSVAWSAQSVHSLLLWPKNSRCCMWLRHWFTCGTLLKVCVFRKRWAAFLVTAALNDQDWCRGANSCNPITLVHDPVRNPCRSANSCNPITLGSANSYNPIPLVCDHVRNSCRGANSCNTITLLHDRVRKVWKCGQLKITHTERWHATFSVKKKFYIIFL